MEEPKEAEEGGGRAVDISTNEEPWDRNRAK